MGASSDLFYASMEIYHGKLTLGNVCRTHSMQFTVVKGSFTAEIAPRVTAPYVLLSTYGVVDHGIMQLEL